MVMCRIDGTMDADERHAQVKRFQVPGAKIPVFLLTSQVRLRDCGLRDLQTIVLY